jgi:crotonobetainyl-CoA:carnitine CoA-transferase CaiB-like acyl-CoA transferase
MLLAEHGADVIKVEPAGGDPWRDMPEYRVWNRGRRSIEVDLSSGEGKDRLLALAGTADVLVESFSPGTMARLGLDYPSVRAACPQLIYMSAPAYPAASRHAARAGWDALVQARSGLQYEQPGWRPGPIFLQNASPSMAAAYLVPTGILAALSAREETGRGQHVETSIYQGALALTTMLWIHAEHGQNELEAVMSKTYPPGIHQRSVYECADGWIHATAGRPSGGRSMNEILGLPDELNAGRVMMLAAQGTPETLAAAQELQDKIGAGFKPFRVADLVEVFHGNGLGAEAIVAMGEVLEHPQMLATDSVVEVNDPEIGALTQLGVTIKLLGTPGRVQGPRPAVGQHTAEILTEIPTRRPRPVKASGRDQPYALADVRVLDFGRAFAGPYACMVLASLGADVIRVEAPGAAGMMSGGHSWAASRESERSRST